MRKLFLVLIYFNFSLSQERTDTVMFTYYDWQVNAHMKQRIYYDPGYGVYVIAMVSYQRIPSDRNVYYNFFDERLNMWTYGQQGVPVFPFRAGYGTLDVNPNTHDAYCIAHFVSALNFCLAIVNIASPVDPCTIKVENYNLLWPVLSITNNGWFHIITSKGSAVPQYYDVCYIRMREWGYPEEPRLIAPRPGEPISCAGDGYGLFASKRSNKVITFWRELGGSGIDSGAYRISFNGGDTWSQVIPFPFPNIFTPGSETLPEISFVYGFFDREDSPNFVICYTPNINGLKHPLPVEIWHFKPGRNPELVRISRRSADTLAGLVGIGETFAGRPTIAQEPQTGTLYVSWEEFDPLNYDPSTGRLRGDIWVSYSLDNGLTWSEPEKITQPNQTSKRYPCLAPIVDEQNNLWITYLADLIAGFYIQGEDTGSLNPVIVKRLRMLPQAIKEDGFSKKIYYKSERASNKMAIYDINGKKIGERNFQSKGVYFLVDTKDKKVKKIIVFK